MRRSLLLLFVSVSVSAFAAGPVKVQVLSAVVKDQRIDGAEIIMQKNGAQSVSATTRADGLASLTPAFADTDEGVLLIIKKPGFSALVSKCPCSGMTYALSPVMRSLDGLRVVLTWGSTPADLDLHTVFPGNHVFFSKKLGRDANLDVDDTDSFGPETVTIEKKAFGQAYLFAVHDFTNRGSTVRAALAESHARVFVYVGESLIRQYDVPSSIRGTLWEVFSIDEQGDFHDINSLTAPSANPEAALVNTLAQEVKSPVVAQAMVQPVFTADATSLNADGERAYHAGRVAESIDLYRRAVDVSPAYGQAWSNLGLSYRKLSRNGEALWATRQAISVAAGPDASSVRASSYYNIARIYEAEGQLVDALVQYQLAAKERPLKVYEEAIRRVQSKAGR